MMQKFTFAGVTMLAGLLSTTVLAQQTRVFDVSLPLGAESHQAVGVLKFGEELDRLSEGRLTIRPHYDNALGAEREVVEGIGFGLIDMGITSTGPMGGFAEPFLLFDLPYIFKDHAQAYGFLDSENGAAMAQTLQDAAGVKIIAWMENGFRNETNSVRPITELSDLNGIKHRTQESSVQVDTWTALGTDAAPMAWTEVFTALQQGVMESQENPIPTIYDVKFYDVQDYLAMTQHVYSPAPLMVGAQLFESMSAEDQAIILEAAALATPVQRQASQDMEASLVGELETLGMEITKPDLEPFRAAVQPVIEKWKETVGADLVDAAMNFPSEN
ncbi:DctP family TRAP transporter solute-binding subunit [Loktanella salsilacus]|jgi:tripartite ATP-independent transporter DctP family solute receptor|uniref:DctP family TRAP transporter solute-binding subunit n=1 Tax=Loktanella salsilacus TaxID=195913 RepID=UPI0020B8691C|nr:DctP family TRAP transporter solute-binding subunit [Loktanella salsilacus]UTH47173.1 DctP family TRAP transporter solute-binding subunit [Loktanella salsilacus]